MDISEKLKAAKEYLGERYCLSNPSTLEYRRAEFHLPNLAERPVSFMAARGWFDQFIHG